MADPSCPVLLGTYGPSISSDGARVVFSSNATTLVPLDLNGASDVFIHDRTQASIAAGPTPAPNRPPTCLAPGSPVSTAEQTEPTPADLPMQGGKLDKSSGRQSEAVGAVLSGLFLVAVGFGASGLLRRQPK
jgi:hypothetical protein